ncbi:MAG: glycosyltransferase family 2 protein [Cyanobacteriota bacterium]
MREFIGVLLKDLIRYELCFRGGYQGCLRLRNRNERLAGGPGYQGYVCLWPFTSKLHAPQIIPCLGRRLLAISMANSEFQLKSDRPIDGKKQVSVIIGHRGMDRLPLLLSTLASIAGQEEIQLECLVVEQDREPLIKRYLPSWVRHIFLSTRTNSDVYNRSAAFNHGVMHARGEIILLHDNDMLVPIDYCSGIYRIIKSGYEAVNTKRFIFYLSQLHTERILNSFERVSDHAPDYIVQNLEAGGSMAITRKAYIQIGGMDEEFVGWGGEDIDFWRRCSVLNRWIWGYQPIIHLWHKSQPLKNKSDNPNILRIRQLEDLGLDERIASLREKNFGGAIDA